MMSEKHCTCREYDGSGIDQHGNATCDIHTPTTVTTNTTESLDGMTIKAVLEFYFDADLDPTFLPQRIKHAEALLTKLQEQEVLRGRVSEMSKLLREDKSQKPDFTYVGEMYRAFARVMWRFQMGEEKYARLNWRECEDPQTYKESAVRHLMQYINEEQDEDHAAAVIANILILMDLEEQAIDKDWAE